MNARASRTLALAVPALLLALVAILSPREPGLGLAGRLLGPLRPVIVTVQWVRSDAAFADGRTARGFALAESALQLSPRDPGLWRALVWRQAIEFASPDREPDPARRGRWLAAGLDLADRGARSVRDPGDLMRLGGDAILLALDRDAPLPEWPGGRAGLVAEAERRYRRAIELGDPLAEYGLAALEERR